MLTPFSPLNPPTYQGCRGVPLLASTAIGANLSQTVVMAGCPLPATLWLNSADATKNIQFSVDGGTTFQNFNFDWTNASQIGAFLSGVVTHVKFTGLPGDTFGIL